MPSGRGCAWGWEVSSVTRWPRVAASAAMEAPVRPVKMLVRQRTLSMGACVLPAVTRMCMEWPLPGHIPLYRAQRGGVRAILSLGRGVRWKYAADRPPWTRDDPVTRFDQIEHAC